MTENVKTNERWYKSENRLFHAKTVTNKSALWCGLSPYMSYQTSASRHAEVAAGSVYPSYHYILRDKFMIYEVASELSRIQIPMRSDFVLKVTMDDAA